ncbi:diguanylate cyclase [Hyalangium sp.]|uniref:GGDEF domain-containing response regulator n=1 Tax=Hyalangium sp. TaxID=2028555 RepID=UPI002D3093B3|nr:diguanylate cyclase [Hyalangium sp.]HYI01397.1 diguanylate cyclase [Hyalangium sp.]
MARILLVDDEKMARTLYGDYLRSAGHVVTAVGRFEEFREALEAEAYDAVVTDLILPGADGMEVLRYSKERYPGIEVVVITGLDKVDPAVRAIKSGAAEYLVKPVAPEALQHAVRRALTTRDLLRENASLRQYVSLLEMGQRIATTLDRERLAIAVSSALEAQTLANAVLLLLREGGPLKLHGHSGLDPQVVEELEPVLCSQLQGIRTPRALDALPVPYEHVLAFPASDGELSLGQIVLFFSSAPPENVPEVAGFLSRHYAMALRNLGRFAEVEDLAYMDDLTHLYNMRYLHLVLDREVKAAQQTQGTFSLLFMDLDHFKSVNDTHGHLVGSRLLVEVGRVLKSCVRERDVVVRYGGDEYVVLLRSTDAGGALKVAERIRRTMERHAFVPREGIAISLTTCVGVASFPEHARDKGALLDMADRAMYRGKRGTRNVVYMAALDLESPPAERKVAG